jgi:hypothetical protein
MTATPNPLAIEARETVNHAANLIGFMREALPDADRQQFDMLSTAGAEVALTMKWADGRVELKCGMVTGDSEPITMMVMVL